ncbi:MAG: ribose 5-phosphate isomerase A [Thaumarchaeota archaeon]|nr:ribose 5-phosphate isomerase A [Nitrososphaerota archaeon]
MSGRRAETLQKVAEAIADHVKDGALLGLGSGSTVAALLPILVRELKRNKVQRATWVPTSMQIQLEAERLHLQLAPLGRARVDLVVDGADQVDADLNLIKGGGGALLKEKVLLSNSRRSIIVADARKFAVRLCEDGVKVPVETSPFARVPVAKAIQEMGGEAHLRLDQRGFPLYTENGNLLLDVLFEPLKNPAKVEREVRSIPGVAEVGVFTVSPLEVFKLEDSGYALLRKR